MTADIKETLESILNKINLIDANDIPNIDLYMDQVTTFMESHLGNLKRSPDDKVLTKTMINNYAKNHLLPSPDKKKYSRNHMILLTFIYYFKNVLPINDIKTLMSGITEKNFAAGSKPELVEIYREIIRYQPEIMEQVRANLDVVENLAEDSFAKVNKNEEKEELKLFTLLCLLSFDVYIKKTLIESVIDSMTSEN
ncbi:MAG: DUF1836 domain-containing protein [Lachnospiraceae bacterium]